ncbi:isopeptide-forming domain-containing fimbrial protein [Microbulbifer sp. ALW1]|uniref:isopeptide-forming domain-containing fimbrial protein n=1 Tax=Microbulbifer sp. (strain ALW1) TaxID=1516059 RepID=UPI001357611C|nr:isopeptide-forming domain-containing fimbrial protein [Microbulbifer sp. ALW1]
MKSEVTGQKSFRNALAALMYSVRLWLSVALLASVSGQVLAAPTGYCVANPTAPTQLVDVRTGANVTYCDLCGYGYIEVQITNPYRSGDDDFAYITSSLQQDQEEERWGGRYRRRSGNYYTYTSNGDYGSFNPDMDFSSRTDDEAGLVVRIPNASGLRLYQDLDITAGGTTIDSNNASQVQQALNGGNWEIRIGGLPDLADGNNTTMTVRIPVHRPLVSSSDGPEQLNAFDNVNVTAEINYVTTDSCTSGGTERRAHTDSDICPTNWSAWTDYENPRPPYPPYPGTATDCTPSTPSDVDVFNPTSADTSALVVNKPVLEIDKQGWNYDAGQREGTRSDTVYGHNDDDIVWRLNLANNGTAPLQDLRIDDVLSRADVMNANFVCPTQGEADAVAANNGVLPGTTDCVATDALTGSVLADWDVLPPFGDGIDIPSPYAGTVEAETSGSSSGTIDIAEGGEINLYLVGKLQRDASCSSGTPLINSLEDVQFGCAVQTPPGGIIPGLDDTGELRTWYGQGSVAGGATALEVERTLTGIDGSATVGMRGLMTITLSNQSGGTVWFDSSMGYHLRDQLPDGYVLDPSFAPQLLRPAGNNGYTDGSFYGDYAGQVDQLQWVNPEDGVDSVDTTNYTSYLGNTAPEFKLSSSTQYTESNPDAAYNSGKTYRDLMRHGDVVVIRFAIIHKDPAHFDRAADLDVVPEEPGVNLFQRPEPTDPVALSASLQNTLEVDFKTLCDSQGTQQYNLTDNGISSSPTDNTGGSSIVFDPEDLDVEILDQSFIVTNDPDQTTPLRVRATNNGGVDARDASIFISFGPTLEVVTVDERNGNWQCDIASVSGSPVPQPSPYKAWVVNPPGDPDLLHLPLTTTGTAYRCYPNHGNSLNRVLAVNESVEFHFEVRKALDLALVLEDDVTFRADAIGEIWTVASLNLAAPTVNMSNTGGTTNNRAVQSYTTTNTPTAINNHQPLWFPQPGNAGQNNARSDGEVDRGNLYSLDANWSRGIGFNLLKDQVAWSAAGGNLWALEGSIPPLGECNESSPATLNAALPSSAMSDGYPNFARKQRELVQIGEECTNLIQTGGWFGFKSRGFSFIGVRDIQVQDEVEDGLVYISNTEPQVGVQIAGATPTPNDPSKSTLDEGFFGWLFTGNQAGSDGSSDYITTIDQWFHVNATTRIQNKALNARSAPNVQAADRNNVLNSSFEAAYHNENTGVDEYFDFGNSIVGYPWERIRRVDVVVTEPEISLAKNYCEAGNFSSASGDCSGGWQQNLTGADTSRDYIVRLRLVNANETSGEPNAPAYDLVVTDTVPDLLVVVDPGSDGIDNDGDGAVDEDNEHLSLVENTPNDGVDATLIFSHSHSDTGAPVGSSANNGLRRLNGGTGSSEDGRSVNLYYKVNPDERIAPNQMLQSAYSIVYDTLEGGDASDRNEFGNQTVELRGNGDIGGARAYDAGPADASITFITPAVEPKEITALSDTTLGEMVGGYQAVKIGEEIEYTLTGQLPYQQLRGLIVSDTLPAGLSCVDAPSIDLSAPPYAAAGFRRPDLSQVPVITPVCSGTQVSWDFGDVTLTTPGSESLFSFPVRFIARVDNTPANNNGEGSSGTVLENGTGDSTFLRYADAMGNESKLSFGNVSVRVIEPELALEKSWTDPQDAGDDITVTLTATNNGSAPAYNLRILEDLVDSEMTFIAGSVNGTDPPAVDTDAFGENQPVFVWAPENPLLPGEAREFTFLVRVGDSAQPQQQLQNTAHAAWTSLPTRSTALNPIDQNDGSARTGQIGVNGAVDGMRIGELPLETGADAVNDYEISSNQVTADLDRVLLNKQDLSPGVLPEIGAHKQFQITIDLPEGTTQELQLRDLLDSGSTSYVLTRDANYEVSYTFTRIASINGNTALGENAFSSSAPVNGASGEILWDIGTVLTETESDLPTAGAINPQIVITYYARINNDTNTGTASGEGNSLQNGAELRYQHGSTLATVTETADTPAITVTESVLSADKSVTQITPGQLTRGSVLEYVVTLTNNGNATAYDLNLVDSLPEEFQWDDSVAPTVTISGSPVAGFVATPDTTIANTLVWGRGNSDGSLDLPAGQQLLLTYQVTVAANGGPFTNEVTADWTSLQDDVAANSDYERTGADCPAAPNDYCITATETTDAAAEDNTALVKAFESDSWVLDGSDATDAELRVGDTVDYRLTVTLNESVTANVTIADTLPVGLEFVDLVSVNGQTSAPFENTGGFTHEPVITSVAGDANAGQVLTLALGDVDAVDGNDSNNEFTILYRARVVTDVLAHQDVLGPLNNQAELSYDAFDGSTVALPPVIAAIAVHQPLLSSLVKTDTLSGRAGSGTQADPYLVVLAADTMQFRLQSCNQGDAPAYNVQLSDTLAPQLNEAALSDASVFTVAIDGTATSEFTYSGQPAAGGSFTLTLNDDAPLLPDQCLTVDYSIGFSADIGTSELFRNSASVSSYWSLPGTNGQQYSDDTVASVWMQNPSNAMPPEKVLTSAASATIGEEVRYRITIPEDNIARTEVVLTDTLAPQFTFVSAALSINGGTASDLLNSGSGSALSFELGTLQAGETAQIELLLRVANSADSNAGDSVINQASYSTGGVTYTSAATDPLTIVEPQIALEKEVIAAPAAINAGTVLDYRLSITEAGSADSAAAYELVVTDVLDAGLEYVSGSASIGDPVISGDAASGFTLEWNLTSVAVGESLAVDYQAVVQDDARPGQVLNNVAEVRWTSLSGDSDWERDGSETPAYNDYLSSATASVTVSDNTSLAKALVYDTFDGTGSIRVGDRARFAVTATMQKGTYPSVVITDTLPVGMVFEEVVSADFFGSDETSTVASAVSVNGAELVFTLGDVTNPASAAGDTLQIVYEVRVQNGSVLAQLPSRQSLENTVALEYALPSGPASAINARAGVEAIQPLLAISRLDVSTAIGNDSEITVGEQATFTLDITNDGEAPAYDLQIQDVVPEGMRNGGGVTTQSIELLGSGSLPVRMPSYDAATGIALWDLDDSDVYTIPAGGTLRLVYTVTADDTLGAGLSLGNGVTLPVYYSFDNNVVPANGVAEERQDYRLAEAASAALTSPLPAALDKNITQPEAAVGEQFSYRITVPATPADTALYDVRIFDDLSASAADLRFIAVNKISGADGWTPENIGDETQIEIVDSVDGIDIPAGEQIEIELVVEVLDTDVNVAGLTFTNTASYRFSTFGGDLELLADTSQEMTLVEPELTLEKAGPETLHAGIAGDFTLNINNVGDSAAWDISIIDILPDVDQGGMCGRQPEVVSIQIFDTDTDTLVSALSEESDYQSSFADCTFTLTTTGVAVEPGQRLLVEYQAWLDEDTAGDQTLVNLAAAQWFSQGEDRENRRAYGAAPTDGTPEVLDHEDAHALVTQSATLQMLKEVVNVTSGQEPGKEASPGDTLRYTLTVNNVSEIPLAEFSIEDELGVLNTQQVFAPGTLTIIELPENAVDNSDAVAGATGSGWVRIGGLTLAPQGESDEERSDSVTVVFEVQLASVIDSGTAVLNQSNVIAYGQTLAVSDDPNINGTSDPESPGEEDPTQVIIESAPVLKVEKTSEDLTGEPDSLMPGDTLRYTIRVENIGNENMLEASLRDQVPANTVYVAGSTTLNGTALDDVDGSTPLAQTLVIQSPGAEEGELLADPEAGGTLAALITFDVTINDVNDGTVISNQGFANGVGAGAGAGGENTPIDEKPSDDPTTEVVDDPTINIVGNVPLLRVQKTVELAVDNMTAGIIDPEDVLRYTITVRNMGGKDATEVRLVDLVPEHTTYVAGSTTLNGIAVADNGGESPLVAGIAISSDDLTPPMPTAYEGIITTAQTATIVFDVMVNVDTERGTIISNQGNVYSLELPLTLSDADGNSSNGAQPTEVVVGDAQQLSITKEVAVVGGGAAESGEVLEYLVRITNISAVPASLVSIYDDLLVAGEGVLTYVEDSGRLNGQPDGVMVDGPLITVDYSTNYGDLEPSESITLRFQAKLGENLAIGYSVVNTAQVKWNDPAVYNEATVSIDIGGTPGIANLSGYLWHDVNFDEVTDSEERLLTNWTVNLYFNNGLLETVQSDDNGYFVFDGLVPNMEGAAAGGATYELRYLAPNAVESTASLGNTSSDYTNGPQQIRDIYIGSGANPQNLNLPITPNGVVYDSVLRQPVSGARVRMLRASSGQPLPDTCFEDPKQQNQVTMPGGYYKFDVNFSNASCTVNADYLIEIDVPNEDYVSGPSQIIPPQTGTETGSFDVAACLGSAADLIPGTPDHCEVQLSDLPPPIDMEARSSETDYYLRVNLDDSNQPGSSQLFNNHIALDPQLEGALALTKTAAMLNVTRSQLVPYTITFTNSLPVPLTDLQLVDYFPAGFKYVAGSASLDGMSVEPEVNGLQLQWPHLRAESEQTHSMKLLLVVGSGVGEGKYVNRARMFNELSGQQTSGEATATVRVVPDPTFDCTDVVGKVYDDKNLNGYQDSGEGGVPGARVVTANGLKATTDAHGRFHITCAAVPNPDRGSNFVLKLDDRSLPSGYRLTTENPRVQRATRGKMLEFNFGTSLHRVVRLDLAEAVFEPGSTELRPQWHSRTELLLEKLQDAPSLLRLSYLAENEDPALVDARLAAIKAQIAGDWAALDCCYPLNIETEIFWRRGAPPSRGGLLDGLKRSVDRALGTDTGTQNRDDQGGFN